VSYDSARGEPRKGSGDCIDCGICVQVCPVGIDIRDGLQYPCINCGLCIAACPTGALGFEIKGLSKLL